LPSHFASQTVLDRTISSSVVHESLMSTARISSAFVATRLFGRPQVLLHSEYRLVRGLRDSAGPAAGPLWQITLLAC